MYLFYVNTHHDLVALCAFLIIRRTICPMFNRNDGDMQFYYVVRPGSIVTDVLMLNKRQGPVSLTFFLPVTQIRWKISLAIIPLLAIRSQQISAHATTAQLSCHVQNFVAITVSEPRWEWNEISIEFELRWKNRYWNGPQNIIGHRVDYIVSLELYEWHCTILILLGRDSICFRNPAKTPVPFVSRVSAQNPASVSLVPVGSPRQEMQCYLWRSEPWSHI